MLLLLLCLLLRRLLLPMLRVHHLHVLHMLPRLRGPGTCTGDEGKDNDQSILAGHLKDVRTSQKGSLVLVIRNVPDDRYKQLATRA